MKTLEWQHFFAEQSAQHGKVVFSVAELANAARTTLHAVNTELGRLVRRGIIHRYAHGRYGLARGVDPEQILAAVDPGGYVTGFCSLYRHHLVTQVPTEVTCFTNRRHNRKPDRITPAGRLRFVRVPAGLYAKPAKSIITSAEQALCDFTWLNLRDSVDPQSLVTFQNLERLNSRRLQKALRRYPQPVQNTVGRITGKTEHAEPVNRH